MGLQQPYAMISMRNWTAVDGNEAFSHLKIALLVIDHKKIWKKIVKAPELAALLCSQINRRFTVSHEKLPPTTLGEDRLAVGEFPLW